MVYQTRFLISLLITLLLEVPIVFIFVKYIFREKIRTKNILLTGFLASILTLPYVWFVISPYVDARYYIIYSEIFAIITEALLYNQFINIKFHKSIAISIIANAASYFAGAYLVKFAFS
ncbi:hypothetical protein HZA39_03400 [Candidatus Peregrinibacteria bacterium]|nr:hypothetical protein [Candidatus Peregrinibacteria bacterium]